MRKKKKKGGVLKRPFSIQQQNVLYSADDKLIVSAILNQYWLCSVGATFGIIGL